MNFLRRRFFPTAFFVLLFAAGPALPWVSKSSPATQSTDQSDANSKSKPKSKGVKSPDGRPASDTRSTNSSPTAAVPPATAKPAQNQPAPAHPSTMV